VDVSEAVFVDRDISRYNKVTKEQVAELAGIIGEKKVRVFQWYKNRVERVVKPYKAIAKRKEYVELSLMESRQKEAERTAVAPLPLARASIRKSKTPAEKCVAQVIRSEEKSKWMAKRMEDNKELLEKGSKEAAVLNGHSCSHKLCALHLLRKRPPLQQSRDGQRGPKNDNCGTLGHRDIALLDA
jgi:hypothetical protein